ncbi:hypothetical protein GCM10007862_17690 [Dyella lipolytica]|uniref:DUF2141 domain-containing protein n=1 Tax=Dyella lipolytica TaxID=1867835 RepID=A0ABW8ISY1_9GAMM|nr:DUF2141 domain-containing protein [Dyella lipolytica]GLQ46718.1 hypothetical protein GCM10007862_17690 [Dyella lipolytica]
MSVESIYRPAVLAGIVMCMLSFSARAADITVTVDGLRNANGTVRLELDGSEAAWNNKAKATAMGNVKAAVGAVSYTFSDIQPGTYGLGVYQDEDNSGKLRTNLFGIPKEGYGFSNNPSVMRMPTFQEVQFTVAKQNTTVLIHLKHGI